MRALALSPIAPRSFLPDFEWDCQDSAVWTVNSVLVHFPGALTHSAQNLRDHIPSAEINHHSFLDFAGTTPISAAGDVALNNRFCFNLPSLCVTETMERLNSE